MLKYYALFLLVIVALLQSCNLNLGGENVLPDLDPPPNHKPQFIKEIVDVNKHNIKDPRLIVSRVDTKSNDKVRLNVHFIDDGAYYLKGAALGDWLKKWCKGALLINGKEVPVENMTVRESTLKDRKPLAMAIVMDHSGSMGEERAYTCQEACLELINNKKAQDAFTLIKYDNRVSVETPLTISSSILKSSLKINGLQGFGGFTAVNDATLQGIEEVSKSDKSMDRVVVVFTDGYENSSINSVDSVIKKAKENNVTICAIDFGYGINDGYMEQFSNGTNGIYHHIYKKDEFTLAFEDIYRRFEYFYVVEFDQPDFGEYNMVLSMCLKDSSINDTLQFNNLPDVGFINLLQVNFDSDKSTIKSNSNRAIKKVAAMMKVYPGMQIELRGHTDSNNKTGDANHNLKLSQSRADAVRESLIKDGIEASRIKSIGFGDSQPISDNNTEEGRAKNRRTEFVILKK
ncbi:MAG TPA: OmpA family protein [Candidatus Kapabacteria bacterium]|nr:OmpA family protein [Candidatus Kapabacteria bacterium]